jgi:hypothetical protein
MVAQDGDRLVARLAGTADMRVQTKLEEFLKVLSESAAAAQEVRVELTDLEFMNSSCLAAFIHWIDDMEKLPRGACRIVFRSNKKHRWQQRSLTSMTSLGYSFVSVEES